MNEINRREFFKKCYQIGGYAAIAGLGLGAVRDARGWGILPAVVGGAAISWTTWKEDSEATLVKGSDGAHIWVFICDGGAGVNETAQSGTALSGANLVATQNGSIAGHVNNWRSLDGTDDYFTLSQIMIDTLIANANKTWTVLFHINNWAGIDTDRLFSIRGGVTAEFLELVRGDAAWAGGSSGKLTLLHYEDSVTNQDKTTNNFPTGNVWVGVWSDAVNTTRFGFTAAGSGAAGQPTKWSDFAAGNRSSSSTLKGNYAGEAFDTQREIGAHNAGSLWSPFDLKTVVIADTCLIDNNS